MTSTLANRNTWWVTRPKRSLAAAPGALRELVVAVQAGAWTGEGQTVQRSYERRLEQGNLKAGRSKRDPNGGGPRTYKAWLESLGLCWTGKDKQVYLTMAGDAIVRGDDNLQQVMTRQVLHYQFPSPFTCRRTASSIDKRFKVRPFVLLLQLLLDERLGGYLMQSTDVAKIVLCYGDSNSQTCVDDLVQRILALREHGDGSLPTTYLEDFQSRRSREPSLDKLFANLNDIANTVGNWLAVTQLVSRSHGGRWEIADGARQAVEQTVTAMLAKPLLTNWEMTENFQRRYGLTPGAKKDNRSVEKIQNASAQSIRENAIVKEFTEYASFHLVDEVTDTLVQDIARRVAAPPAEVRRVIGRTFKAGHSGFLQRYLTLASGARATAREFEQATTEIFSKVFGYEAQHLGGQPLRPDVVLRSQSEGYGALLDAKAYAGPYTLEHAQRGVMRNYIESYDDYALGPVDLAFFSYVVNAPGPNIDVQLREVSDSAGGVMGSAVTANDLATMVTQHLNGQPYSHAQLRSMFSANRLVELPGREHTLEALAAESVS